MQYITLKRIGTTISILVLLANPLVASSVFAQTTTPAITLSAKGTLKQQIIDERVTNLKERADTEITRRVTSLTNLTNKLGSMKHITPSEIATFTTNIQTEISNLNLLKTKIDADTDITTLRSNVQSIVKDYRVYLVYLPQTRIIITADKIIDIVTLFNTPTTGLIAKLQTRLQGNTNPNLTSVFTNLQAKVADAQTQAQNAINAVTPLTPQEYPGTTTTLQSARTMLMTARQDLLSARNDAQTIIQGLKAEKTTLSISPTIAPTE